MNFQETLEISQHTMITNNLACQLFELINKIVESQCFCYFSLHSYKIYFESHANIFLVTHYIHRIYPSSHKPLLQVYLKRRQGPNNFPDFCSLVDNRICGHIVECPSRNSKIAKRQNLHLLQSKFVLLETEHCFLVILDFDIISWKHASDTI